MAWLKPLLSLLILAAWGPYLLYVWIKPSEVPGWAMAPGFRRALMLDRYFEPTVFTLLFGTGFSIIAIAGGYRLLTGTMLSHHLPNTPAQGRSSAAVPSHRRGQSVASLDRETRNRRIEFERQFDRRHASLLGDDQPRCL